MRQRSQTNPFMKRMNKRPTIEKARVYLIIITIEQLSTLKKKDGAPIWDGEKNESQLFLLFFFFSFVSQRIQTRAAFRWTDRPGSTVEYMILLHCGCFAAASIVVLVSLWVLCLLYRVVIGVWCLRFVIDCNG